jgi:hypothetical protein
MAARSDVLEGERRRAGDGRWWEADWHTSIQRGDEAFKRYSGATRP